MIPTFTPGFLSEAFVRLHTACAGDLIAAHHHAHRPASHGWAPRADFLPADPSLRPLILPRPHATNEVLIAWGRGRGRCCGWAGSKVSTLLDRLVIRGVKLQTTGVL